MNAHADEFGTNTEMTANTEMGLFAVYEATAAFAGNASPPDVSTFIAQFANTSDAGARVDQVESLLQRCRP